MTKKPDEIRMGKGKGAVCTWIYRLEAGKMLYELNNVAEDNIQTLLQKAGKKLPTPTVVLSRRKPGVEK